MSNTISLNKREVQRLYELFNTIHETGEYGVVTLNQTGDNGIGSNLTATFFISHKDSVGTYTVTITDESHW